MRLLLSSKPVKPSMFPRQVGSQKLWEKRQRRAGARVAEQGGKNCERNWPTRLLQAFVHALTRTEEAIGFPDPAVVAEGDKPGSKFIKLVSPMVGRRFVANPLEAMNIRAKPRGDLWGRDAGEQDELRSCYADLLVAAKAEPPPAPITAKQAQEAGQNFADKSAGDALPPLPSFSIASSSRLLGHLGCFTFCSC